MLLGYLRVSKADGSQTTDLQRDALQAAGVPPEQFYEDFASGAKDDRPGLAACLKALRGGDVLVVWKLDRLGRNLGHLVALAEELKQRGIGLKVLTGHGAAVDTTTPAGKLVFGIFAALAEFERELIVERTRAGLAAARALRRASVQDDGGQAAAGPGGDGSAGNAGRRTVQGVEHYPPDAVSPRRAAGGIAAGRPEAARGQATGGWRLTPPPATFSLPDTRHRFPEARWPGRCARASRGQRGE